MSDMITHEVELLDDSGTVVLRAAGPPKKKVRRKATKAEEALFKLTGHHPAVAKAYAEYPDLGKVMLYETGRTPKRSTRHAGWKQVYERGEDGQPVFQRRIQHNRQPHNGVRPVLIGWHKNATHRTTRTSLFLWNL